MTARRGRPTKAPPPGRKASLGLKVTARLKARIERAAYENGRTQSQEAEARLARSFDAEDFLQAARLAFLDHTNSLHDRLMSVEARLRVIMQQGEK